MNWPVDFFFVLFYKSWARTATPPLKTKSVLSDPFSKALPAEGLLGTVGVGLVVVVGIGARAVMTGGRVTRGAGGAVIGAGADTNADAGADTSGDGDGESSVGDGDGELPAGDGDGVSPVGDGEGVIGFTETLPLAVCFFLAATAMVKQATRRKVVVVNFMVIMLER